MGGFLSLAVPSKLRPIHFISWLSSDPLCCSLDRLDPAPLKGLMLLDVGCGGGLLSEVSTPGTPHHAPVKVSCFMFEGPAWSPHKLLRRPARPHTLEDTLAAAAV